MAGEGTSTPHGRLPSDTRSLWNRDESNSTNNGPFFRRRDSFFPKLFKSQRADSGHDGAASGAGTFNTTATLKVTKFKFPMAILKDKSDSSQSSEIPAVAEYDPSKEMDCISRKFLERVGLCNLIEKVEVRTSSTDQEHKSVFKEKVLLTWFPCEMKDTLAPYKTTFYLIEEHSLDVIFGCSPLLEVVPRPSLLRRTLSRARESFLGMTKQRNPTPTHSNGGVKKKTQSWEVDVYNRHNDAADPRTRDIRQRNREVRMREMEELRMLQRGKETQEEQSNMGPTGQMLSGRDINAVGWGGNPSQAPSEHALSTGTARPSSLSVMASSPSTVFTPSPSTGFSSSPTTVDDSAGLNPNSPPLRIEAERPYRREMPPSPSNTRDQLTEFAVRSG